MLNVAVVGLGWWGRTIAGLLKGSAKLRISVGVDVAPTGEFEFPVQKEFEKVLQDPKVQAVILCTPHSQHC